MLLRQRGRAERLRRHVWRRRLLLHRPLCNVWPRFQPRPRPLCPFGHRRWAHGCSGAQPAGPEAPDHPSSMLQNQPLSSLHRIDAPVRGSHSRAPKATA